MVERFDSLFDCALRVRDLGGVAFAIAEFRGQGGARSMITTTDTPDVPRRPFDDLEFLQRESRVFHLLPVPRDGEQTFVIGRSRERDLRLRDGSVSARHASIVLRAGSSELFLIDHGSKNGTFLDGRRVPAEQRTPGHGGAVLRLGNVSTLVLDPAALARLARGG